MEEQKDKEKHKNKQSRILSEVLKDSNAIAKAFPGLMNSLQKVELESPEAKLNETSIKDSKGERIRLVEDVDKDNSLRK